MKLSFFTNCVFLFSLVLGEIGIRRIAIYKHDVRYEELVRNPEDLGLETLVNSTVINKIAKYDASHRYHHFQDHETVTTLVPCVFPDVFNIGGLGSFTNKSSPLFYDNERSEFRCSQIKSIEETGAISGDGTAEVPVGPAAGGEKGLATGGENMVQNPFIRIHDERFAYIPPNIIENDKPVVKNDLKSDSKPDFTYLHYFPAQGFEANAEAGKVKKYLFIYKVPNTYLKVFTEYVTSLNLNYKNAIEAAEPEIHIKASDDKADILLDELVRVYYGDILNGFENEKDLESILRCLENSEKCKAPNAQPNGLASQTVDAQAGDNNAESLTTTRRRDLSDLQLQNQKNDTGNTLNNTQAGTSDAQQRKILRRRRALKTDPVVIENSSNEKKSGNLDI